MDPLSGAASVITVLGLSLQSIKVIYQAVSGVKDGRRAVQDLADVLSTLESLLQQLVSLKTGFESDADIPVSVQKCAADLKIFETRARKMRILPTDKKLNKVWTGFKLIFEKQDMTRMKDILQGHVANLALQLSIFQRRDLGIVNDNFTESMLQASDNLKGQLSSQSDSIEKVSNRQMQLAAQNSDKLVISTNMLDQMQSSLRGVEATSSSLETNISQRVDSIGYNIKNLMDASMEQADALKTLSQQLQHQMTERTRIKDPRSQPQEVYDSTDDVDIEEDHNQATPNNDYDGLDASLDRLFSLASERQSTVFSLEAQSIIDDVEQLLNAISKKGVTHIPEAYARRRKLEELTGPDNTEDIEHEHRIKRIRGSLIASQCLALNKTDTHRRILASRKHYNHEETYRGYNTSKGTLTVQMNSKRLIGCTGKDYEYSEDDKLIEAFGGTIAFVSKTESRNSMMTLSFQQKMSYQGSYLQKPIIFFSAIVPEDSEVFSLVKRDALDDLLRLFAAGGAKFTDRDPDGRSLLAYACIYPAPKICKYLIKQGADVNGLELSIRDRGIHDSLLYIWPHNDSMAQLSLDGTPEELETSLACRRLLLGSGADPTAEGNSRYLGDSVLWMTVYDGIEATLRLLLDKSHDFIDLEAVNDSGDTLLLAAAFNHQIRIVQHSRFCRLLVSRGAKVNARNSMTGETCLHRLLSNPKINTETLIYLIKAGADLYAQDNRGSTVSEVAYRRGHTAWIWESALTECGFDVEEFRRAFYSTLGPVIDTSMYHIVWFSREALKKGKSKVCNIYWARNEGLEDQGLEDKKLALATDIPLDVEDDDIAPSRLSEIGEDSLGNWTSPGPSATSPENSVFLGASTEFLDGNSYSYPNCD